MVPDAAIVCFYLSCNNSTHSAVYYYCLAQSSAVGTPSLRTRKTAQKNSTSCVPATAAAAAAARPPQPINRAAVGAVGFCCRPFDFTTHTTAVNVLCILRCKSCAAGNKKKCLEKYSYAFIYFEARPRERSDRGRFLPLGSYTWLSFN